MQQFLQAFVPQAIFAYMLIFARLGGMMMLLPGIGEVYISPRIRMAFALLVAAAMFPMLQTQIPTVPPAVATMILLVTGETLIGIFMGVFTRIVLGSLETAGMVISSQMGISAAVLFNPILATQGSLISVFLTLAGIEMMFLTDLHQLFFTAMRDSYTVFPVAQGAPLSDMSQSITKIVSESFRIAVQLSAPFLVLGVVFFAGMGLLSRLMPQMQIFFIVMPLQILLGLLLTVASFSAIMLAYLDFFHESVASTMLGGGG